MKSKFLIFFKLFVFFSVLSSQVLVRGPYLQMGSPNSIILRWRTDIPTESSVRFGEDSLKFDQIVENKNLSTDHEIKLSSLKPSTFYYYSVGTTNKIISNGPNHFFKTAPITGSREKTKIWILGDSGTANSDAKSVKEAYYYYAGDDYTNLWVMLGDNAYSSGTDQQYQDAVFKMYPEMLRKSVLWPAFGNHDGYSADSKEQKGVFYDIFSLPKNGESGGLPSGTEAYYSFDYANIHFICLNSHDIDKSIGGKMIKWLEKDLELTKQEWVVAYWHHPAYTKGSHDSDKENRLIDMRENALPILEKGGADLVFFGHSHSYERSYLINGHYGYSWELKDKMILDSGSGQKDGDGAYIKPSSNLAPNEGTVYFTAGSSGKISGGSLNHPIMYISQNVLGSVVLEIEGGRADIVFLDINKDSLDYLTLFKGPPIWSDLPDTNFNEDDKLSIHLDDFLFDHGDKNSELMIESSGNKNILIQLDQTRNILNVTSYPDSSGYIENIKLRATDPWGAENTTSFKLKVNPIQDPPAPFEWVSTAMDSINISQSNLADTYLLQWGASTDVDGDSIDYLVSAKIGVYPSELIYDTTVTTLPLSYQEIVENVFEGMPNERATIRFSVSATDGIDTVKVTGDDRVLFINRYDYLSTEEGAIPSDFALHENYPNPFNPTTTLRFDLPEVSDATVTIYNMLGQIVRTFNMNDTPAGYHSVKWDATNDYGDPVGAGVYLYQLRANEFVKTKKMVLLK